MSLYFLAGNGSISQPRQLEIISLVQNENNYDYAIIERMRKNLICKLCGKMVRCDNFVIYCDENGKAKVSSQWVFCKHLGCKRLT
jgi:hypothetical protein